MGLRFNPSFAAHPGSPFLRLHGCWNRFHITNPHHLLLNSILHYSQLQQKTMDDVHYREEHINSTRGVKLFTCRWLPSSSPKALVFLCHGYGMECGNFMSGVGMKLAGHGYGVFGIDYEGHGRSAGARCYISRFDNIVADCTHYFQSISGKEEHRGKKRFLYGESMGGAVALLVHKKNPSFWDGAILVAPMCKISEKVKPHPVIISLLLRVVEFIPKWKIVPTKDVIDSAFKDPIKREEVRNNKFIYQDKPRLKTALELLRTSMDLEESLKQVTLPFFVLHGEADTVTDPEISRALYEQASSNDKTMKLYSGMWHALTSGEPDDNIETVISDILSWLDQRSATHPRNINHIQGSESLMVHTQSGEKNPVDSNDRRRLYHQHSAL